VERLIALSMAAFYTFHVSILIHTGFFDLWTFSFARFVWHGKELWYRRQRFE